MNRTARRRFLQRTLLALAGVLVSAALWANNVTVPHTFAANTPAKASDVNDNFSALAAAMNKTTTFQHVTNNTNITADTTCIDNPATNGDPNAMIVFSRVSGNGHAFLYLGAELALQYSGTKWCIYREDKVAMPADLLFNVIVVKQ